MFAEIGSACGAESFFAYNNTAGAHNAWTSQMCFSENSQIVLSRVEVSKPLK